MNGKKGQVAVTLVFVLVFVVLILFTISSSLAFSVFQAIQEDYKKIDADKDCILEEKIIYCSSLDMELGNVILHPGDCLVDQPYNRDACINERGQKIINFDDLNWKRCVKR